jgi:hypothetical protein
MTRRERRSLRWELDAPGARELAQARELVLREVDRGSVRVAHVMATLHVQFVEMPLAAVDLTLRQLADDEGVRAPLSADSADCTALRELRESIADAHGATKHLEIIEANGLANERSERLAVNDCEPVRGEREERALLSSEPRMVDDLDDVAGPGHDCDHDRPPWTAVSPAVLR